ncbi:MAG: hypothetical protein AAF127_02785 [Pseudomonadota bacterium]
MTQWVPWLLILLTWSEGAPEDRQVVKIEVAVDQQECEKLGEDYVRSDKLSDGVSEAQASSRFGFVCSAFPERESFNAAVERWKAQLREAPKPE